MIKISLQKYHLKNRDEKKKAALVQLLQPATEANILKYRDLLEALIRKSYDCFILVPGDNTFLNALTLKLLIAFYNTIPGKVGLLVNEACRVSVTNLKLDTLFCTDENSGALIAKIESGKKQVRDKQSG